jgi:hypothetical protein
MVSIKTLFSEPLIIESIGKNIYEVRLHDGRISEMYDGPMEYEPYIEFQKSILEQMYKKISSISEWKIDLYDHSSTKVCKIEIPSYKSSWKIKTHDSKYSPKSYEKMKCSPIACFPFTSRGSLCAYYDNIICTKMISSRDTYGPRRWSVCFHNKNIIQNFIKEFHYEPSYGELEIFKGILKKKVIQSMKDSSLDAKWVLVETSDSNSIIHFDQY